MGIDQIRMDDGVFVHGWMIFQGSHGSWWAYRDGSTMYSQELDDLLLQIAHAHGPEPDLGDLRGRFGRSLENAANARADAEAWKVNRGR